MGSTPTAATMERDYILENIQSKGNHELYIPPETNRHGHYFKGHKPWNRGKSWDEMGISKETQKLMRKKLEMYQGKGNPKLAGWNSRPVIAIDEYGEQVHWYKSAADAARKLGLIRRNITRACVKGYYCGDFRWKYDSRFDKE